MFITKKKNAHSCHACSIDTHFTNFRHCFCFPPFCLVVQLQTQVMISHKPMGSQLIAQIYTTNTHYLHFLHVSHFLVSLSLPFFPPTSFEANHTYARHISTSSSHVTPPHLLSVGSVAAGACRLNIGIRISDDLTASHGAGVM